MGHIKHNAIVVTCWSVEKLSGCAEVAKSLNLDGLGPSEPAINGYSTLIVVPAGSKEGWGESTTKDHARTKFKDWLKAQRYEDGSSAFEWAEISYGSDDKAAEVIDHEWIN